MSLAAENTITLLPGYKDNAEAQIIKAFPSFLKQQELSYQVVTFNEGETIFKEGDLPKGVYILKSGCVKLFINRHFSRGRVANTEYVTKLVSPGEIFGYKAMTQNGVNQSFAKAVKKTTVWVYSKEAIEQMLSNAHPLLMGILQQAVADIHNFETTNQFHYLASVQERIAYQLVNLADKFGVTTSEGVSINLRLTRNEFAQLASTINESLSRHLTEFKNEGLIDLNGKEIIILKRSELLAKAGQHV